MIKPAATQGAALLPRHQPPAREGSADFNRWIGSDQGRSAAAGDAGAQRDAEASAIAAGAAPSLSIDGVPLAGADLLLEFHVSGRGGEQELLALPWRLSANGRLSHLLDAKPQPPDTGLASSPARAAATRANAALAEAWVEYRMCHLVSADAVPPQSLPMPNLADPLQSGASPADASESAAAPPRQAGDGALAPWASRLLRWIESEGRDATLWIRDYRLDPDAARRLGELMHGLAREHGTPLQRIVVNGRELWRAERGNHPENL